MGQLLAQRPRRFSPLSALGPGLITGAADDDPSGIATYSQAGAQFGVHMLWTCLLTYPFMAVFQSVCGRIGRVTGKGLAANIRAIFPRWVLLVAVALLLVANILNVSADVAAMGESAALLIPGQAHWLTIGLAVAILALQVLVPYHRYVLILKWLTLALFSYVAVALMVKTPWDQVLTATFLPRFKLDTASATLIVGVFGTTISPYLFFWQASEEVEEIDTRDDGKPLKEEPSEAKSELRRIAWDTGVGMAYSNIIAYFVILSTAVTLHANGVTNVETAAQAASALRPLGGELAFVFFALGIVGTGLLSIPTLAGSAAYALSEAMGWKEGLENKFGDARGFYAVIGFAILGGVALSFSPIDPIKALFWSAVVNGVAAAPLMAIVMLVATRKSVMGAFVAGPWQRWGGWAATVLMAVVAIGMFVLMALPGGS